MGKAIVSSSGAGAPGVPGGGSWSGPGGGGNGEPTATPDGGTAARAPGGGAPGGRSPIGGTPGGNCIGGALGGNCAPGGNCAFRDNGRAGIGALRSSAPGAASLGLALPARGTQGFAGLAWPLWVGPHETDAGLGSKFCANAAELAVKHIAVADCAMAFLRCSTCISPHFFFLFSQPSKWVLRPTIVLHRRGSGHDLELTRFPFPIFNPIISLIFLCQIAGRYRPRRDSAHFDGHRRNGRLPRLDRARPHGISTAEYNSSQSFPRWRVGRAEAVNVQLFFRAAW